MFNAPQPSPSPAWLTDRFEALVRYVNRDVFSRRAWTLAAVHVAVFAGAYFAAFALRFDLPLPAATARLFRNTLPWVLALKMATFYLMGHSRIWWRHVTFADLIGLGRTVGLTLILLAALCQFNLIPDIPRTVMILDALLTLLGLGGLRALWRATRENLGPFIGRNKPRPVLLVGTDSNTGRLANHIHSHPELPMRVRGFLSFHGAHCRPAGYRMGGIPVLGSIDELASIADRYRVVEVLVTAGTLAGGSAPPIDGRLPGGEARVADRRLDRRTPPRQPAHPGSADRDQRPARPRTPDAMFFPTTRHFPGICKEITVPLLRPAVGGVARSETGHSAMTNDQWPMANDQ